MRKITFSFGMISIGILLFIFFNNNYRQSSGKIFDKDELAPEIELYNPKGKKINLSKLRVSLYLLTFGPHGVVLADRKVQILLKPITNTEKENL